MASFHYVYESMTGRDSWDGKKSDSADLDEKAMSVIQRGLEIRPDRAEGDTFWDDFIKVIGNNSDGASRLLGVSPDVILRWTSKIREAMKKVREDNDGSDERADMIQTGIED